MLYTEHPPHPALANLIRCIWVGFANTTGTAKSNNADRLAAMNLRMEVSVVVDSAWSTHDHLSALAAKNAANAAPTSGCFLPSSTVALR